jgi:glycosyltransferase involved in cell wall biosynthesis
VEDGVTGLLVPLCDPRALRTAIERLLGDPALRAAVGAAARERALREYAPEATTARLVEAYREALG